MLWTVGIREKDRQLARVVRSSGWLWDPSKIALTYDLWEELIEKNVARSKVVFVEGAIAGSLGARAVTWGRRIVTLPEGFSKRDRTRQLPTLTHELRHCDEFPHHAAFRLRYVADVRFRWAIECQGVLAELRCLRALGALRATLQARAERAADAFARAFPGYAMGRIRHLKDETVSLLMEAA